MRVGTVSENFPEKISVGFVGHNVYTLDSKNRVPVLPDFLRVLDSEYKDEHRNVITFLSLNLSIAIYPLRNYQQYLASLQEKSMLNRNMLAVMTMIEGSASQQVIDSQGRLRLTDELLKYAGISPRPVDENSKSGEPVTRYIEERGFRNRFEIWSPERWHKFITDTTSNLSVIQDALSK